MIEKLPFCCVPGVWGVCGLDDVGVTGPLGVNGFAAGFNVYFFGALYGFSTEISLLAPLGVCYDEKNYNQNIFNVWNIICILVTGVEDVVIVVHDEPLMLVICCAGGEIVVWCSGRCSEMFAVDCSLSPIGNTDLILETFSKIVWFEISRTHFSQSYFFLGGKKRVF